MSLRDELQWDAQGLIPVVVQDVETGQLLMVAWMNADSLEATRRSGLTHFWSRSRNALWRKGETSGHAQHVEGIYADCDRDTLLVQVHQDGVACHTGARSCFYTSVDGGEAAPAAGAAGPGMLEVLERVLESRKAAPPPGSYVAGLLEKGQPQICRKIGEEAAEVMTAALGGEGDERVVAEVADLWFHTMVLLTARGIPLRRVFQELARRHKKDT
ncbi:MAG: bifunctional phosphoribosyl-AMP cyclohydrolase/phosphoribosyl-ATP diphosphatase HisIE [Candidatus Rokuibacteriota bacterium]